MGITGNHLAVALALVALKLRIDVVVFIKITRYQCVTGDVTQNTSVVA